MADRILILDDELSYANMLAELLQGQGYSIVLCTDPNEAMTRIEEEPFSLIVSDFKMPKLDGEEILREIRKMNRNLPVIIISGFMNTPELLRVANIGVTLVLEKPFDVDVFLEYVSRYVSPSQGEEKSAKQQKSSDEVDSVKLTDYPQPLTYLVDQSKAGERFVSELWQAIERQKVTLVEVPGGGEFGEVVKEVCQWKAISLTNVFYHSLAELKHESVRESLLSVVEDCDAAYLLCVSIQSNGGVDAADLETFVQWYELNLPTKDRGGVIVSVPAGFYWEQIVESLGDTSIVGPSVKLPQLSERLLDIAVYTERFLDIELVGRGKVLDKEAVRLLLHYDWPNNYRELLGVLRRAFRWAPGNVVSGDHMERALRAKHGSVPDRNQLDLETFLRARQTSYLKSHVSETDDLNIVPHISGMSIEDLDTYSSIDDLPLIFEDLIVGEAR